VEGVCCVRSCGQCSQVDCAEVSFRFCFISLYVLTHCDVCVRVCVCACVRVCVRACVCRGMVEVFIVVLKRSFFRECDAPPVTICDLRLFVFHLSICFFDCREHAAMCDLKNKRIERCNSNEPPFFVTNYYCILIIRYVTGQSKFVWDSKMEETYRVATLTTTTNLAPMSTIASATRRMSLA